MIDPAIVVVILSIVVAILALTTAILAGSVPFLYWRMFRTDTELRGLLKETDGKIAVLDQAMAQVMEVLHSEGSRK